MTKTRSLSDSFRCAVTGVRYVLVTERNMRIHFLVAILVVVAAALLRVAWSELACLVLAISLVLISELVNTALELVCDMMCSAWEVRVKAAKDIAAGAVLVSATAAAVVGACVLGPRLAHVARILTNQA